MKVKKLLAVLGAGLLLTGCSGGGDPVTKTCSMTINDAIDMEMVLDGKGDTLEKIAVNMSIPYEFIDIDKDATEEEKEEFKQEMEKSMADQYESSDADADDVDITSTFDDKGFKITLSAEASLLEKTVNASSIEEAVKEFEAEGFTCK